MGAGRRDRWARILRGRGSRILLDGGAGNAQAEVILQGAPWRVTNRLWPRERHTLQTGYGDSVATPCVSLPPPDPFPLYVSVSVSVSESVPLSLSVCLFDRDDRERERHRGERESETETTERARQRRQRKRDRGERESQPEAT